MKAVARSFAIIVTGLALMSFADPEANDTEELLTAAQAVKFLDKQPETMRMVIHAYAEGISWANTDLARVGNKPIYCPPQKLAINAQQNVDIFKAFVKNESLVREYPAAMVMLMALKATFPCE